MNRTVNKALSALLVQLEAQPAANTPEAIQKRLAEYFTKNTAWRDYEYSERGVLISPQTWEDPAEYDRVEGEVTYSMTMPSVERTEDGLEVVLAFVLDYAGNAPAVVASVDAARARKKLPPVPKYSREDDDHIALAELHTLDDLLDYDFESAVAKALPEYKVTQDDKDSGGFGRYSTTVSEPCAYVLLSLEPKKK